ncbi:TadE/TadG family type IV pilus assembly protein [Streptomyces sp. NPDC059134]|uniref:TadE/TadG family type IV pilus assembly protein n=1 Tax=Streptomyces sp. NPDC059134 TaxID=3346738 RepID=UPI00369BC2CB
MAERKDTRGRRDGNRQSGQVALEYLGFVPLLLLVGFFAIQIGIVAYVVNQAGTAARAAARTASQDEQDRELLPETAGRRATSDWLSRDNGRMSFSSRGGDNVTYTARVKIPSVVPGIDDWGWVERSSTMPRG